MENQNQDENYLKSVGAIILSELNDLKRDSHAAARELGINVNLINGIIAGDCSLDDVNMLIARMGEYYPIDASDLYIPKNDCFNGIRIMRAGQSEASSRIFNRKTKDGFETPFYEYRDTAMSKLGPFKPEWIKELRIVGDSNPENPDVAYNRGHFMHQMTFFIGHVNFYWEDINGKKHSAEMEIGDSNYITPFHPHSFASRNKDEDAIIIAVTFGGDVRRAQKELYSLGGERIERAVFDYRNSNRAAEQLIRQHMRNEKVSDANLEERIKSMGISDDIVSLLNGSQEISLDNMKILARALNVELSDLMIPRYKPEEDVVVKKKDSGYLYPDDQNPLYRIHLLAKTSKMPLMKGYEIEILSKSVDLNNAFESSLHSYIYNYGNEMVNFLWEFEGNQHKEDVNPGDSLYVQPFIKHAFSNPDLGDAKIIAIGVSGAMNLSTQKELSYFSSIERVAHETGRWF